MSKFLTIGGKRSFAALGLALVLGAAPAARAAGGSPESFTAPEQAVAALVAASRADNPAELVEIFGPAGQELVSSGDPIADSEARSHFVERYGKGNKIVLEGTDKAVLMLGEEEWPFPIPLVRHRGAWQFDTRAGAQEILNRRIGRNELNAMDVCRSYVQAQRDYAADLESAQRPAEFAQKIVSTPGRHDGLYWPVASGEKESPIGPLMASARAEGYAKPDEQGRVAHAPYHGYLYRILTRQGPAAPGGARDYLVDGHMTGGFALIAFPASYGDSGVMTFMIDQDGVVYQKDLGPNTAAVAAAATEFNPDLTWQTQ
jgi:Protein of unknown function (DUF2950)